MKTKAERLGYYAIITVSMGVVVSNTLESDARSLGTVMIAIGGLLLIAAMAEKKKNQP